MKLLPHADPSSRGGSSHGEIRSTGARLLVIVLASGLLVWLLDPALFMRFAPGLLWRNALPVAMLMALIYGLSGRLLLSIVLTSAIGWVVFKANAIKELNLDTPLLPGDLVLWRQAMNNIGFFAHYTGYRFGFLLLVVLLFVAATIWVLRMERRWQHPRRRSRLAWALVSTALLYTLFHGDGWWWRAYVDEALAGSIGWDPNQSVHQDGLLASLVRMTQAKRVSFPTPDRSLVLRFQRSHASELKALATRKVPTELPDIVVVQSEAFFDPGVLKTVAFGQYAPNFARLAAAGITGSLATPTYGGGTIRTEFETLTGYPMRAFPNILYPYFGLAAHWMPSVPHRLESLDYSTALFHPFKADFWNRDEAMPQLGFQRSYYENDFAGAAHAGSYVSDRALFDFVLAHLRDNGGRPSYTMVITMENHGPWDRDDALVGLLKGKPLPDGLSTQGRREMTYYLSHLVNGDAALGEFAQRLLARPRWTILLFYGDHLPALGHAFVDLGFNDNGLASSEHTRYMLLSNRPFRPGQPLRLDLHAYDLPGLLFDTVGLPEDGYLAVASAIRGQGTQDRLQPDPENDNLQFNAAALEVSCHAKLGMSDACARPLPESAPAVGR